MIPQVLVAQSKVRYVVWCWLLIPTLIAAQSAASNSLTLTAAVQRVRQNHPLLVAAKQRVAMFEGELFEAGLKPNPTFTVSGENIPLDPPEGGFGFKRTMDWFAYFSHTIERGNKRELRRAAAERAVEVAQIEAETLERQLVYEVKVAYQQAAIARERIELLRENINQLGQLVKLNEVRVNAGYTAEGDLIKTRLEAQRLDYSWRKAMIEYDRAKIALQKAMGDSSFEADFELEERLDFKTVSLNAKSLQDAALRRSNVKAVEARLEKARAFLQLQRASAKPDLTASFGYKRNGQDNALYGALSIPLPLYNKNQGNIARSEAEVAMIEAELRFERAVVLAELTAARRTVEANERQIEALRSQFLRNADESQQVSLAAYREGATDLLHLIDAQRTRTQAQELYFQALSDYQLAIHELERAAGIEQLPRREIVEGTKQ
ncbi:MAG: TolC family protein [Blastocatellia bacterium]|nr:TolC family protein [Blastocatellia bacterium]